MQSSGNRRNHQGGLILKNPTRQRQHPCQIPAWKSHTKLKNKSSKNIKVKILGTGELKTKISLITDKVSKSAKDKIEKSGGSIELVKR